MSYIRQTFKDFDENNPLSAAHMKHIEDGIVAAHDGLLAKVPMPETASVGQYLKVTEVDDQGRITKVETVVLSGNGAELPTNVVTCDLEGATEDDTTVPVNADTLGGEFPSAFIKSAVSVTTFEAVKGITVQCQKIGPLVILSWDGYSTEQFEANAWKKIVDGLLPNNTGNYKWAVFSTDMGTRYTYTVSTGEKHFQINPRATAIPANTCFRGMLVYVSDIITGEVTA